MANLYLEDKFDAFWDFIKSGPYEIPDDMKFHIKIALEHAYDSESKQSLETKFTTFWDSVQDGPYEFPEDMKSYFKIAINTAYKNEFLLIDSLTFDEFSKLKFRSLQFKVLPQPEIPHVTKPPICASTDYTYVESDEKLGRFLCPICIHPAVDPIAVQCCGEVHCKTCFTETFEKLGKFSVQPIFGELKRMPCVKCKVTIGIGNQVRIAGGYKDFFDELTVSCGDCNQTHRRDKFNDHWLHNCKTACTNQCGQSLSRTEQVTHGDQCPMVKISCPHRGCTETFFRKDSKDLTDHTQKCLHGQFNTLTNAQIRQLCIQQLASQSIIGLAHDSEAKIDSGPQIEEKKEIEPIQSALDQLTVLAQKYSRSAYNPSKQDIKTILSTTMVSIVSPLMIKNKTISFNNAVLEVMKSIDKYFNWVNYEGCDVPMKLIGFFIENNWNQLYAETH
jgi:RNase P subunit RPR2